MRARWRARSSRWPARPITRPTSGGSASKGSALHETGGLAGRLLHPAVEGRRASWDEALARVAGGFARVIAEHGPQAVAFYLSGQLLTEDYYVANKLMKGFIGSANVDTNSRLCMASAVAGYKRAFGADAVPCCYEDLECCDLLVLTGSNAAWTHPVLYQRIEAAKRARPGMRVVVIDPRRTASCDVADLHLAIRPGSDALLFTALLAYLQASGSIAHEYVAAHTEGLDAALAAAGAWDLARASEALGIAPEALQTFCDWFAATERTVTFYSQGINQSATRHRQVQRDHQLPPGHRAHRARGHGAVLDHRPAQRDGRARGGRAGEPARGAHGFHARGHRARGALLGRAAHGDGARPEGGGPLRCHRARRGQGGVDHGHQPGGEPAGCRSRAARAARAASWWWCRTASRRPIPPPARTCCCRPPAGARRTAP